jgi:hypothetical protein
MQIKLKKKKAAEIVIRNENKAHEPFCFIRLNALSFV